VSNAIITSYPYRPKIWTIVWTGLFFVVCAAVLAVKAATNERGVIIS
jgi:hypothetical protein